jgi:site-specific recombinase XerC
MQLRLLSGGAPATSSALAEAPDPMVFHAECLEAYAASQVARGFSQTTMDNGAGVLERFLAACGRPAWEITREDVDRVVAGLAAQGLAASTRRGYVQAFKGFHGFLVARKSAEIEAAFGVRLVDPVDEFNSARHVGADSPESKPPPGPKRLEEFFDFCKQRIATARKYSAAGRDYALFRTLYLAAKVAAGDHVRFSPHGLRHACATRNYERGVDLVAIQQMLGHWHVGTTMRYVTPSATFIEDAYRRAISGTLASLGGDRDAD